MMSLFIFIYDNFGAIKNKIGPFDNEKVCMEKAINTRDEMNIRSEIERTLFGVTIKDENGIDRWNEIVRPA
jgi:hypothetical protein